MSILSEYEKIRKSIGEKEYQKIEEYLSLNKDKYLSDIYYNESEYKKFEKWKKGRESGSLKNEVKEVKRATAKKPKQKVDEFTRAQNIRVSRGGKICLERFEKSKKDDGSIHTVTRRIYKKPTKANLKRVEENGYSIKVKKW